MTTPTTYRPFPSYEQDYAQWLLKLDKVSRGLTLACQNNDWKAAKILNAQLSEIQLKLGASLQTYEDWYATPAQVQA